MSGEEHLRGWEGWLWGGHGEEGERGEGEVGETGGGGRGRGSQHWADSGAPAGVEGGVWEAADGEMSWWETLSALPPLDPEKHLCLGLLLAPVVKTKYYKIT